MFLIQGSDSEEEVVRGDRVRILINQFPVFFAVLPKRFYPALTNVVKVLLWLIKVNGKP